MKELKETLEMNAADTTIPSWKAELIQRKRAAQKNKAASEVTIPEWKRELLKRIHSKSEFSKSNMGEVEGDMDEHILKVSDNIFMRQEQTRKASIGLPSTKTKTKLPQANVAPTPGYHVTRADNIVIIEREDEVLDSFTSSMKNDAGDHKDQDDIEMPSVGIVSRLKNKFKCKSETPKLQRALSTDIILSPRASEDLVKSPTSPNHPRTFSLPRRNGPLQNGPTSPKRDFTTPSSFKIGNTVHKVTSPRFKKIAPVKVDPITPAPTPKIDTSNLHAPGYIKPDEANSPKKFEKPTSPVRSPISSPTKQDSILLRSGSVESKPTSHTTPAIPPQRLSLTRPANSPVRSKPIPITDIDGKENVPDIPERTTMAHTKPKISPKKSAFKPSSPEKQVKSNNGNFEIRDLGKTSLDPSLLTSKAAIIANDIMKNSKTIQIVPKRRQIHNETPAAKPVTPSTVETNAEIVEAQVKTADNEVKLNGDKSSLVAKPLSLPKVEAKAEIVEDQSKITNKSVKLNGDKSSKIAIDIASDSGNLNISNSIPSSSIDEVIINEITPVVPLRKSKQPKSPTKTDNAVNFSTNNLLTKVEPKPVASKIEQKPLSLPPAQSTKAGQNTIVKSSSPGFTQPSITSANSLFGPKIGGNKNKGFGSGKSFVIDPSKFKRSSAVPPVSNQAVVNIPKTSAPTSQNSHVINPKSTRTNINITTEDSPVNGVVEDNTAAPTGKRKLTVDQITVIGGYVKLEHSNLSSTRRNKKVVMHVQFDTQHMDSIFQYPSEASLLQDDALQSRSLMKQPGYGKESQLGKYTPKYLLSMRERLATDDETENIPLNSPSTEVPLSLDATPLNDDDATAFSSSSSDLLF